MGCYECTDHVESDRSIDRCVNARFGKVHTTQSCELQKLLQQCNTKTKMRPKILKILTAGLKVMKEISPG